MRVLDLSRFIAGPICAQILGDMGADVVKVERPGGEDARFQGPFLDGESLYPMAYNRNKAGITLDTRHPDAGPLLERLIAWADVLVENYRPGTLDAMGIGWDRLHEAYPRLILTSLSGFGQTGPLAHRALFDPIAQAASGLMSLTGQPDGPPALSGTYIADHVAGLYGAIGTLVSLIARGQTGTGQRVDVASLDALVSCMGTRPMASLLLGEAPRRAGARDPYSAPANVFPASDGHVYIHGGTDSLFPRLCAAIGRPQLLADARFGSIAARLASVDAIELEVAAWTISRTRADHRGGPQRGGRPVLRRRDHGRGRPVRAAAGARDVRRGGACRVRRARAPRDPGEARHDARQDPHGAAHGRGRQRPGLRRDARPHARGDRAAAAITERSDASRPQPGH